MVVLEDVDLVATERTMPGMGTNPLLFQLLNEMDGLNDDADVVFDLQAFSAGDAEEAAKDYDDDSVMITQNGQVVGQAAIKAAFAESFSALFKPGTYEFTIDAMEISGDVAFIAWHADTASHEIPLGTDTFVVRDAKIAVQTFAAQMNPK